MQKKTFCTICADAYTLQLQKALKIRVAPIIGSVIGIGRYWDISTVSVIGTGHVIFASKDASKA